MALSEASVGIIYLGAAAIALSMAKVLWENREKKGALPLSVAGLSATIWAFSLFLSTLQWEFIAVNAMRTMYIGVGLGVAAGLVFALEYTGRERYVTPIVLGLLSIHPILLVFFAFVNPGNLFFAELNPDVAIGVEQQWGPAFWVHSAYSYLLSLVTAILVVELLVRANRTLYRGQALLLVTGLIAPLPLNALFLSGVVEFDTTPLGFIVMYTFFAVAIVRYQFINIAPIARQKVIDNVRDGMLVVDTDDMIIDSNPEARRMLGVDGPIVGDKIEDVLNLSDAVSAYEELTAEIEPTERTVSYGELYMTIEVTPIRDDRQRHVGWLFLLQDVSEQKRRERNLEQQIENLDQFASLVSHDLRNPINVASGYIQQTKATGDIEYLDKAEEATERMEAIIEDVLALAREGQEVTDPEEVSLQTIASEGWSNVDTKGASLSLPDNARIVADGDRLKRLFENLFRNSVEHGSTSSRTQSDDSVEHGTDQSDPNFRDLSELTITVGVANESETELTLFVADDGVGIPEKNRDRVFEDGYTTGSDGTGLGLAIVEQIAHAHGWEVSVTESEAGGAQFEIHHVSKPLPRDVQHQ